MKAPILIFAVKLVEYFFAAILVTAISNGLALYAGLLSSVDTLVWFKIFQFTLDKAKSNHWCLVAYIAGAGIGTYLGVILHLIQ